MSSEALTLKESLIPFFGESEKALMFFNANYEKGIFSQAINTAAQPEEILNKRIFEMMLAKNYIPSSKEPGMDDNDIHYQFVDFIVRTALLHKELDRPTTAFPTSKKMRASFENAVDTTLSTNLATIDNFGPGNQVQTIVTNPNPFGANVTLGALLNNAVPPTPNNEMQKSYFDYICASVFSMSQRLVTTFVLPPTTLVDAALLRANLAGDMQNLAGDCQFNAAPARPVPRPPAANSGINMSTSSNLCYMTYWGKNDPQNSAVRNLVNLLDRVEQQMRQGGVNVTTQMDDIFDQFLLDMRASFENEILNLALRMYQLCGFRTVQNIDDVWSGTPTVPANPVDFFQKNVLGNVSLRNTFIVGLKNSSAQALQKAVSAAGIPSYSAIPDSEFSYTFCTNVLGNWKDLDPEAREFYRNHIAVFRRLRNDLTSGPTAAAVRAGVAPGPRPLSNQWINNHSLLDDDRKMEKIDCEKENLRLNLLKEAPGSDNIMFCNTLPFVPVNHVGKLWYTDSTGARRNIQHNNLDASVFKKIYDTVYKDVTQNTPNSTINVTLGTETMTLPGRYLMVQDSGKKWDINLSLIVLNIIRAQNKKSSVKSVSIQELLDNDTGMVWFSDGSGLYTKDPKTGKKISYADYKQKGHNCDNVLALDSSKVNPEQCREIAQCILESPEKLPTCLKGYEAGGYDIFKVAQSELKKMDPEVAKKLLQVFHVQLKTAPYIDKNGNSTKIIRPSSYTEWTNNVLDSEHLPKGWTVEFRKSLKNSDSLLNYVRGVIEFVRTNPAILNHENMITGNIDDEVEDEQLRILRNSNYNIGTYVYPYENSVDELKYNAGFMLQSATAFAPVPTTFSLPYAGAFVGDGTMSYYGLGSMGGGAIPESELLSSTHMSDLGDMLIRIIADLSKSGLSFKPDQQKKIKTFIDDLKVSEKKLKEMIQVLTNLRNLQKFVRCYDNGRYSGYTSGKVLALEEITSHKDLLAWLNSNIGDYENCIYKGMEYINAGSQQVLQAYNDLIQAASVKK
jgi:hypothetical protein